MEKFVHPLVEDHAEQSPALNQIGSSAKSLLSGTEDLEQLPLDELFAVFEPDCFNWLQS